MKAIVVLNPRCRVDVHKRALKIFLESLAMQTIIRVYNAKERSTITKSYHKKTPQ